MASPASWIEESVASLKQASFKLHLSASFNLLPCGLLPEELAELEQSPLAARAEVACATAQLKCLATDDASGDADVAPLTPQGAAGAPAFVARLLADDSEEEHEGAEEGDS